MISKISVAKRLRHIISIQSLRGFAPIMVASPRLTGHITSPEITHNFPKQNEYLHPKNYISRSFAKVALAVYGIIRRDTSVAKRLRIQGWST